MRGADRRASPASATEAHARRRRARSTNGLRSRISVGSLRSTRSENSRTGRKGTSPSAVAIQDRSRDTRPSSSHGTASSIARLFVDTSNVFATKLLPVNEASCVLARSFTAQPFSSKTLRSATSRVAPSANSAGGVADESIARQVSVVDLLEQQAVRGAAPVALESIVGHDDAARVHDGDAGAVVAKHVALVAAVRRST